MSVDSLAETLPARLDEVLQHLAHQGVSGTDAALPPGFTGRLLTHLRLLLDWGSRMDLVSPAPPVVQLERHFLDCLAGDLVLRDLAASCDAPLSMNAAFADVGSGAGFPGAVMAARAPHAAACLIESRLKRSEFLEELRAQLALPGLRVLRSRFEDAEKSFPQETVLVVSRALGAYPQFINTAVSCLKSPGGLMAIFAGPSFSDADVKACGRPAVFRSYTAYPGGPERKIALFSSGRELRQR